VLFEGPECPISEAGARLVVNANSLDMTANAALQALLLVSAM
jgi:hypothetical protein